MARFTLLYDCKQDSDEPEKFFTLTVGHVFTEDQRLYHFKVPNLVGLPSPSVFYLVQGSHDADTKVRSLTWKLKLKRPVIYMGQ